MKYLILLVCLMSVSSCDKGEQTATEPQPQLTLPNATTGAADEITTTGATISGAVTVIGNPALTEYGIVWAEGSTPTTSNQKIMVGSATIPVNYQASIAGLNPDKVYNVRAYAKNATGTNYGQEIAFHTATKSTCDLSSLTGTLANGVVLYLPFCGNAQDRSPTMNHGTVTGAIPTQDRFGGANSAYLFNGNGNKITVPEHSTLNNPVMSISVWFKTSVLNSQQWLLQKSNWSDGNNEMYTMAFNFPGTEYFMTRFKTGSACQRGAGWSDILHKTASADWHHVVFTHDGTYGKLYFDGVLRSTNTVTNTQIDVCPGGNLTIGAAFSSNPAWWNGAIDDVIIYNRAVTASEVTALYQ
jgi:hypothetical protein